MYQKCNINTNREMSVTVPFCRDILALRLLQGSVHEHGSPFPSFTFQGEFYLQSEIKINLFFKSCCSWLDVNVSSHMFLCLVLFIFLKVYLGSGITSLPTAKNSRFHSWLCHGIFIYYNGLYGLSVYVYESPFSLYCPVLSANYLHCKSET